MFRGVPDAFQKPNPHGCPSPPIAMPFSGSGRKSLPVSAGNSGRFSANARFHKSTNGCAHGLLPFLSNDRSGGNLADFIACLDGTMPHAERIAGQHGSFVACPERMSGKSRAWLRKKTGLSSWSIPRTRASNIHVRDNSSSRPPSPHSGNTGFHPSAMSIGSRIR